MRLLNAENREIEDCPVGPDRLAAMIKMIESGVISTKIAKTVLGMYRSARTPKPLCGRRGGRCRTRAPLKDHRRGDQSEPGPARWIQAGKDKPSGSSWAR